MVKVLVGFVEMDDTEGGGNASFMGWVNAEFLEKQER